MTNLLPNINQLVVVGNRNVAMLRIVLSGRAEYFFAAEEEAIEMINKTGYSISQFGLLHFTDMPPGNLKYLAYSQQVPLEMLRRVNDCLK